MRGFSVQKYVKTKKTNKKKGLRRKISGFSVQTKMGTNQSEKRNILTTNRWSYGFTSSARLAMPLDLVPALNAYLPFYL